MSLPNATSKTADAIPNPRTLNIFGYIFRVVVSYWQADEISSELNVFLVDWVKIKLNSSKKQ